MSQLPDQGNLAPLENTAPRPLQGRELMIQEYVQAARQRLNAINNGPGPDGLPNSMASRRPAVGSATGIAGNAFSGSAIGPATGPASGPIVGSANGPTRGPVSAGPATGRANVAPASGLANGPASIPVFPQSRASYNQQVPFASAPDPTSASRLPVRQHGNDRLASQPQFRYGTPRSRVLAAAESRYQMNASFAPRPNRGPGSYPSRARDLPVRAYPDSGALDREQGSRPKFQDPSSHPPSLETSRSSPTAPYAPPPNAQQMAASSGNPTAMASNSPLSYSNPAPPVSRLSLTPVAQTPSVPVIHEEARSHASIASSIASTTASAVLYEPSEGGRVHSGISEFLDGYGDRRSTLEPTIESPGEEPVRKASIGQRQKPVVMHVSNASRKGETGDISRDSVRSMLPEHGASADQGLGITNDDLIEPAPMTLPNIITPESDNTEPHAFGQSASRDSFSTASPPTSPDSSTRLFERPPRSRSPLVPVESRFSLSGSRRSIGATELSPPIETQNSIRRSLLRDRPRSQEPPSPDLEAMVNAPVRDSMTSLRGLILRNLRLASNLERGVTSSRFGLDWILNADGNAASPQQGAARASMLDMAPSIPRGQSPGDEQAQWPLQGSAETDEPPSTGKPPQTPATPSEPEKGRKTLCGLPVWAFILVSVLLLILITAAVVIPVGLIVIPHQEHHNPKQPAHRAADLGTCPTGVRCPSHASQVLSVVSGLCRCVCVDGWAGKSCSSRDTANCATSGIAQASNATAGSLIPRLFQDARSEFDIVLDPVLILSLFSKANMTCASENRLVSLSNKISRDDSPSIQAGALANALSSKDSEKRQTMQTTAVGSRDYNAARAATLGPAAYTTNFDPTSAQTLEFAQIAILYILQSSSRLSTATKSRLRFETYFSAPATQDPRSLQLGDGWVANLISGRVWYDGED